VSETLNSINLNETIEALIFASEKPISINHLLEIMNMEPIEKENKIEQALLNEASSTNNENSSENETSDELSFDQVVRSDSIENENLNDPEQEPEETSLHHITANNTANADDVNKEIHSYKFTQNDILSAIEHIKLKYNYSPISPINLMEIGDGYQLRTSPEYGKWIRLLQISKPVKLTKAALETLAVLAYKQPITKPEIDVIRGVDSGYTMRFLLEKKLARILGKKDIPGKPLLYGTSNEFLSLFSLKNLSALPTLREFRELTEKHAAKVSELFNEPTIKEIKAQGTILDTFALEDENNIAEIDQALMESRKAKSIDNILNNAIFKEPGDGEEAQNKSDPEEGMPENQTNFEPPLYSDNEDFNEGFNENFNDDSQLMNEEISENFTDQTENLSPDLYESQPFEMENNEI